jgi:hypothetical protein
MSERETAHDSCLLDQDRYNNVIICIILIHLYFKGLILKPSTLPKNVITSKVASHTTSMLFMYYL